MAKEVKAANRTRAQKAKTIHAQKNAERKEEIQAVRSIYREARDSDLLNDLLTKAKRFQDYHVKIAQDGVGARETGYKLADGTKEVENIFLTPVQRAGHLDKAAGIQELVDYIDRMTADPVDPKNPKPVAAPTAPAAPAAPAEPVKTV